MLLLVPVLLAACGSVAAPSAGPASTGSAAHSHGPKRSPQPGHSNPVKSNTAVAALCMGPGAVSRVGIKAIGVWRMGVLQPRVRPRYDWVIANPGRASALAVSACALPLMPRLVSCPNLTRGTYKLTFTAAGRQFPVVTVQVTGCMEATGLGAPRSASRPKAGNFWSLLSADTNSPPPDGIPPTS